MLASGACRQAVTRQGAEAAIAQRQREGLARLVAEAQQGPVVRPGDVMVVVDERLVQELLASVLPQERVVARYRIRLTRASVRFEDGFALVRMGGLASLADRAEEQASAEIDVAGGLDVVELDPRTGRLRGQVRLIALDARRVDLLGVRAPGEAERLIEDLGRERLEAFGELISQLEIPVRVERELTLPAVQAEGVRIEAAVIPIRASVLDVEAFRGRLWVSIAAGIDAPPGGERK